jgi:hypothetical protein
MFCLAMLLVIIQIGCGGSGTVFDPPRQLNLTAYDLTNKEQLRPAQSVEETPIYEGQTGTEIKISPSWAPFPPSNVKYGAKCIIEPMMVAYGAQAKSPISSEQEITPEEDGSFTIKPEGYAYYEIKTTATNGMNSWEKTIKITVGPRVYGPEPTPLPRSSEGLPE